MGIPKHEYENSQKVKSEEDFKYNINQKIQNLEFAIDMINKSLSESIAKQESEKVEANIRISQAMLSITASVKEFKSILDKFENTLSSYKDEINQVKQSLKDCITIPIANEKFSLLHDSVKRLFVDKDHMRGEFNSLICMHKSNFEEKLKSFKNEIESRPSEIPNLKSAFDQKLELAELNGQNATLRSSNNERHIQLVEKKIENIYQLIKNLELNRQESK